MLECMRHMSKIPEDNSTCHKTVDYHQPMMVPPSSKGEIVDYIVKCIKEQKR